MTTLRDLLKASTPGRWHLKSVESHGDTFTRIYPDSEWPKCEQNAVLGCFETEQERKDAALICALRNCAEELLDARDLLSKLHSQVKTIGPNYLYQGTEIFNEVDAALSRLREKESL